MGCLSFKLTRIGGITASLTKGEGGMIVSMERKSGMTCRLGLVCRPNIAHPYLEISPTIIWVVPDWAVDNDVFSNTYWNVK